MWVVASLTQSRTCLLSRRSGCCEVRVEKQLRAPECSLVQLPASSCLLLPAKPTAATLPAAPGSSPGLAHASRWVKSSRLLSSGLLFPRCSSFLLAPGERLRLPGAASGELALHGRQRSRIAQLGLQHSPWLLPGRGAGQAVRSPKAAHGPAAPQRPSTVPARQRRFATGSQNHRMV